MGRSTQPRLLNGFEAGSVGAADDLPGLAPRSVVRGWRLAKKTRVNIGMPHSINPDLGLDASLVLNVGDGEGKEEVAHGYLSGRIVELEKFDVINGG